MKENKFDGATYMYNIENDKWELGPDMKTPRFAHSCCTLAGKLYAIGGFAEEGPIITRSIEQLDALKWSI